MQFPEALIELDEELLEVLLDELLEELLDKILEDELLRAELLEALAGKELSDDDEVEITSLITVICLLAVLTPPLPSSTVSVMVFVPSEP